ncbi:MAG: MBL fold metallo-hydrolase [Lachnospiraceae bacterium]|nr:MBL fold metallo-hydrolase [Lachnospiraceae bacterium]
MSEKFHRIPSPGALRNVNRIWDYYLEPFRIAPHVYSVGGNNDVAIYLLDSGDGLILIDTGMAEILYLVIDSIHRLGYDPRDIKKILISHGHGDHYNGARFLQEMSGAKIYMSDIDYQFMKDHPIDMPWIETPFEVDEYFDDNTTIDLGRFSIRTMLTPGHTPGTTSFFFDDTDEEDNKTYHVAMHGGVGADMMRKDYLAKLGLSEEYAHRFISDCEKLKSREIDICLPSHLNQINLVANIPEDKTDYHNFVDQTAWPDLLQERIDVIKGFYPEIYG